VDVILSVYSRIEFKTYTKVGRHRAGNFDCFGFLSGAVEVNAETMKAKRAWIPQ
jgi:hypothetical protein